MRRLSWIIALLPLAAACASGGSTAPAATSSASSDAVWQALLRPRPTARPGARRVSVGTITLSGDRPWELDAAGPAAIGLQELITADLLRREDVVLVERRRFAAAAERERRGQPAPAGAPRVGTSPGAELILTGTMTPVLGDSAYLALRLVEAESGAAR